MLKIANLFFLAVISMERKIIAVHWNNHLATDLLNHSVVESGIWHS